MKAFYLNIVEDKTGGKNGDSYILQHLVRSHNKVTVGLKACQSSWWIHIHILGVETQFIMGQCILEELSNSP